MKKTKPLSLLIIVFISGCLGPKKINKGVEEHYSQATNQNAKTKSEYLSIISPLSASDAPLAETEKTSKRLVPLLFYWKCDYYLTCTMNPKLPVTTCTSAIRAYASSKGLKQKLNNAKLELSIDSIPHVFALFERDHMIWIIYAFTWMQQSFTPSNSDLVISYKLSENNEVTRTGVIHIADNSKPLNLHYMQSVKKAEDQYLDQYDEDIRAMSKKAMDELMIKLQ
jgi:hypothetical protein